MTLRSTMGVALCLVSLSFPAFAESTAQAMQAFGLIGTWSADCAKDPSKGGPGRVTYATPLFSAASISEIGGGGKTETQKDIKSAVRVTDEKIKIVAVVTKLMANGESQNNNFATYEEVVQKIETKIRTIDRRNPTGNEVYIQNGQFFEPNYSNLSADWKPTGKTTVLLEKCLN